jgi:hypothetical protein
MEIYLTCLTSLIIISGLMNKNEKVPYLNFDFLVPIFTSLPFICRPLRQPWSNIKQTVDHLSLAMKCECASGLRLNENYNSGMENRLRLQRAFVWLRVLQWVHSLYPEFISFSTCRLRSKIGSESKQARGSNPLKTRLSNKCSFLFSNVCLRLQRHSPTKILYTFYNDGEGNIAQSSSLTGIEKWEQGSRSSPTH